MNHVRIALAVLVLAATAATAAAQVAPAPEAVPPETVQPAQPPAVPETPPPPSPIDPFGDVFERGTRGVVRVGQDFSLAAGDAVRDAFVVFGDVTIAGQVDRDLIVILGTVRLAGTAVVGSDMVVVGGNVSAEPGANVRRDLVVVGGGLDAPAGFIPGGEHVVIGAGMMGGALEGLVPYISRGLVWGRVIVPGLPWVWSVVALFFVAYLAINVLFDGAVRACALTMAARPFTAFGVGLLVMLLVGPVSLLLAISVIGIPVVPFVWCALLGGWIVGKIAVSRWIGMSVVAEDEYGGRAHAVRSFTIGFVLIAIAYMIPVIGLVAWAIVGVLGLGAAALSFTSAYRRENPVKTPPPRVPTHPVTDDVPPPPVPAPYMPAEAAEPAAARETFGGTAPAAPPSAAAALPLAAPSMLVAMPRAAFRDRLAAFFLDVVLLAMFMPVLANLFEMTADDVIPPLALLYFVGFWTWKQTTVGGIICQLRLVRVDGAPLGFADALVRGLSAIFSLAVFFIGALWILRDPDRQAWHDKIAGTYVVKVPRQWPL